MPREREYFDYKYYPKRRRPPTEAEVKAIQEQEAREARERGENASGLIPAFKTNIGNTPEFTAALKRNYFEEPVDFEEFDTHVELHDYPGGKSTIFFKKGEGKDKDIYQVKHSASTRIRSTEKEWETVRLVAEKLDVVKTYPSTKTEHLSLGVYYDNSGSIVDGIVKLTIYDSKGKIESTSTTVQAANDFCTTNFGIPPAQPQSGR